MYRKSLVTAVSVLVVALGACSAEEPEPELEEVKTVKQDITTACNENTVGLPCDPDGAGGIAECEAVCHLGTDGSAACVPIAELGLPNLDGRICGTISGVGDEACTRHCSGKSCLAVNAPAGAACRPVAGDTTCEGACDGAGACVTVDEPCPFGREAQSCQFAACSFTNATECVTLELLAATPCSNLDACEIGNCNDAGQCIGSGEVGCDDGNPCTDDVCDMNSGACIGIPNTKSCSDGNQCTTGDRCSAGICQGGAARNCDDANLCTTDTCDADTGCVRTKKTCIDDDKCTRNNQCDPATGECYFPQKDCNDNDACTVDSCASNGACQHVPLHCDDNDACTADGCSAGECTHSAITCDDGNPCTMDSCQSATGCANVAIEGCVNADDGGTGGSTTTGNDGSGTDTGTGGISGTGGTGGAASTGGTNGSGGEPSGAGGSTQDGSGGGAVDAGGGSGETGGAGGVGGGSTATSGSGGGTGANSSGGSSGNGGAGGSDSPNSSNGGAGGSGTLDASGGTLGEDGSTSGLPERKDESSGCGCRVQSSGQGSAPWLLGLLSLGFAFGRRRR